ncbi:MAG: CHAT domain-containing protein [Nitrospirae bacterium YQR-1]
MRLIAKYLIKTIVVVFLLTQAGFSQASFDLSFNTAIMEYENGDLKNATKHFREIYEISKNSGNISLRSESIKHLLRAYLSLGKLKNIQSLLPEALTLSEQLNNSAVKAELLNLAALYFMISGNMEKAKELFDEALTIADSLNNAGVLAEILNNLGTYHYLENDYKRALLIYRKALDTSSTGSTLKARVAANMGKTYLALNKNKNAAEFMTESLNSFKVLKDTHEKAIGLVNLGQDFKTAIKDGNIAYNIFNEAARSARSIGDHAALAYALNEIAEIYNEQKRYKEAATLLRKAILLSEQHNTYDNLFFLWKNMGENLKKTDNITDAIEAYKESIKVIDDMGLDIFLNCIFCRKGYFETQVKPVFFDLAELLLETAKTQTGNEEAYLLEAQRVVEQAKEVEIKEYFKDSCMTAYEMKSTSLDKVSPTTAVLYVIPFPKKLDILLSINSRIKIFSVEVTSDDYKKEINLLRQNLEDNESNNYITHAGKLYDWLINPLEEELIRNNIDTIVNIPDGALRTIPFGVLYDGKDFLITKYAVSTTISLALTNPDAFNLQNVQLLSAGVSVERRGFSGLPYATREIKEISGFFKGSVFENDNFTVSRFRAELAEKSYSLIHLATHGVFSGDAAETMILAWDGNLTINDFEQYLKMGRYSSKNALELLTLSACNTAAGDERAALGLAGLAVKTGAKSTIGSLWSVSDEATHELIVGFYKELQKGKLSKAQALRNAQLNLIKGRYFEHPYYWSPFLLIGSWL